MCNLEFETGYISINSCNTKHINWKTLELENVSYVPDDCCDAYATYCEYMDGTALDEDELYDLKKDSTFWDHVYDYCSDEAAGYADFLLDESRGN